MDDYYQHLIGMLGMVIAAGVAMMLGCIIDKWIVSPILQKRHVPAVRGEACCMKRYTVYRFPSPYGTPRNFHTLFGAFLYALFGSLMHEQVFELKDWKTGKYRAYWL